MGSLEYSKHQYVIFILLMQGFRSSDCSKFRLSYDSVCALLTCHFFDITTQKLWLSLTLLLLDQIKPIEQLVPVS